MWEKPEIKGRNLRIERTPQEFVEETIQKSVPT